MVDTPGFWTTLLTHELPGADLAGGGRKYDGLWSYDAQVVERASLLISQAMGSIYQPVRQRDFASHSVHVAEIATRMIGQLDAVRLRGQRREAQAATLTRAIETLGGANAEQAAERLANTLAQVFGAEEVSIALSRSGVAAVAASAGESNMLGRTVAHNDGLSGRALASGEVQFVPDMRQARERDPLLVSAQCGVAAPILNSSGVCGVITIGAGTSNMFEASDARALEALGRLLGTALESNSGGQTAQLARIDQALGKLRWPINRMAELPNRFEVAGPLNQAQRETLTEFTVLVQSLNRALNSGRPGLNA